MIEDYDISEVGAEIRRLCAERESLQRRLDRLLGGDEIESDRLTSTDDRLIKALAERDEALAEVDRYKGAWDCDGETHGPWCREWRRMEAERDAALAEIERLKSLLTKEPK